MTAMPLLPDQHKCAEALLCSTTAVTPPGQVISHIKAKWKHLWHLTHTQANMQHKVVWRPTWTRSSASISFVRASEGGAGGGAGLGSGLKPTVARLRSSTAV